MLRLSLFLALSSIPGPARADNIVNDAPRRLSAHRCAQCAISVDGTLDDSAWADAPRGNGFLQLRPHELQPATEQTSVQVVYDDRNIYVAVRAEDASPREIVGLLARRDVEPPSDWVRVAFDSYADRRTAFEFSVNPSGVKVDARLSGESVRDLTWDAVWDVATALGDHGWTAEFRIPLSELRYSNGAGAEWGFQVTRVVARKQEESLWSPTRQSETRAVARYGTLTGLDELESPRSFQVAPYALADLSHPAQESAMVEAGETGLGARVGADAKLRVTSNLTLDATLNPDFGQVEADPSVVNLTAFETYFAERRPFFVEGAEIMRFGIGIGDGDLGRDTLYYSRRIGGMPRYGLDVGDDDEVLHEPAATSIYGAAKLSGKTAGGMSLAFLDAVTSEARARVRWADTGEARELIAPTTNYLVARAQQDFREGRTSLGAIATSVARDDAFGRGVIPAPRYATTAGLDFNHRSMNDEYALTASVAASDVRGTADAIAELQQAPARYYQRPDNDYASLDPTRTSLQGYAATVSAGKVGGEPWRYALFGLLRSPGFEANDLGFLGSADWMLAVFWAGYRDYTPGKILRRFDMNTNWLLGTNYSGDATNRYGNLSLHAQTLSYWWIEGGFDVAAPEVSVSALRGGPALKQPWHYSLWSYIGTDARKPVSAHVFSAYGWDVADIGYDISPSITVRPSARLEVSLELGYGHRVRDRQYADTDYADLDPSDATPATDHWVVGHMEQDTWAIVARADLAITPELSLQLYAQPFVSGAAFRDDGFREVTTATARADRYEDRFVPYARLSAEDYDFNFKQFRSTAVLRWEYRPGSTLFVVWSQDRTNEDDPGRVRLGRDVDSLFATRGEDVFLVKLSYWLGV